MDTETRTKAKDAVCRILESASFDVADLEPPLDLSAMKREECVLVLCSDNPSEIEEFDKRTYHLKVGEKEVICKKLLFTLNENVKMRNSIVWGVQELIKYSGEATLANILNRQLSLMLEIVPMHEPESGIIKPLELVGPEIFHLPLKIDAKRAVQIASIEGLPHCRYIPHWRYHVVCKGERTYKGKVVTFDTEKSGVLNAINGQTIDLNPNQLEKSGVIPDSEVVQPKISKDEALNRIISAIIEEQSKHIRIKQEKGDAIFYEEKTFKPEESDIKTDVTLMYIPIWEVKGKKIIEVNGFTGEILTTPMDEGVEIL